MPASCCSHCGTNPLAVHTENELVPMLSGVYMTMRTVEILLIEDRWIVLKFHNFIPGDLDDSIAPQTQC